MPPRPEGVKLAVLLMSAMIVMTLAIAWTSGPPPDAVSLVVRTNSAFGATIIGLAEAAVLIAFWNGMEWSRVLVLVFSGFAALSLPLVFYYWPHDTPLAVLVLCKGAVAVGLLIYLSRRQARQWFTQRTRWNKANARQHS